ncbi:hypothetical protein FHR32_005732 [Streptosporangium album]|uniref:Uncharacterized protein n=1 Tax=Streptosporangium album TaxID=47479 RepID=A0A7W7WCI2_9ACTN|nr:hypothetical protein [Streptosporangium album]MBB4941355.1 hypothetical protein [Streptosporangium album]
MKQAPSVLAWTSPVSPPATPKDGVPCVDVDRAGEKGASAGGVRAGPFGRTLRQQHGGVAKLWVAQDPHKGSADALIKVDHVESGTIAYYVRDAAATSTPLNDDGTPSRDSIYPGSVLLPADGHVRITVTIGRASGCFAATL